MVASMNVDKHISGFNAAVTEGDWSTFVAGFADDAVLEFVGPPVGPFAGRDAIAAAYAANPPDDTISANGPARDDGDETVVPYRWNATGATGTMRFTEHDGRIQRLVVTFD
jgi:steroid Delta-isomerase